ncbi:hypothetical protein RKE29_20885 [Streptomyces sp. B1866]|uniref:hypothetical protein n=1 Tax=Streptomyces sp. B1866 TaxID=3075431 RepID=UPI00288CE465|nr:hypothetical protein [Streptomyces sp. B1866]MDT3399070.1 hypothetical protein [Streptomyces sp. B1866]
MDRPQLDGRRRRGPVDTVSIPDAARQLESITRYVARSRDDLTGRAKDGAPLAFDAERALAFARGANCVSLTNGAGETVAVVVSPAVLDVLRDAVYLLQRELERLRGAGAPVAAAGASAGASAGAAVPAREGDADLVGGEVG